MAKRRQYTFTIDRWTTEYQGTADDNLQFSLFDQSDTFGDQKVLELDWYSSQSYEYWTFSGIKVVQRHIRDIKLATNLASRLFINDWEGDTTPQRIYEILLQKRIPYSIYDARIGRLVRPEDVAPHNYNAYKNNNSVNNGWTWFLANGSQMAQELWWDFFGNEEKKGNLIRTFENWVAEGEPVAIVNTNNLFPITTAPEKLIALQNEYCNHCKSPLSADDLATCTGTCQECTETIF